MGVPTPIVSGCPPPPPGCPAGPWLTGRARLQAAVLSFRGGWGWGGHKKGAKIHPSSGGGGGEGGGRAEEEEGKGGEGTGGCVAGSALGRVVRQARPAAGFT